MSDARTPPAPLSSPPTLRPPATDPVVFERCGRENVYRMHAVWRGADCGCKTDCCGW
jgi:hypothetical protein